MLILHQRLVETFPMVDRIACVLYDAEEDLLKTFINSTRAGVALKAYEFKLAESYSLSQLARTRQARVLDDIPREVSSLAEHSKWVNAQGYLSSFTVPLFHGETLLGFVFFDSLQRSAFTPDTQRNLLLYCQLISMSLLNEIAAVHTLIESVRVARDLAEVRDFETGAHLERMARYSRLIARAISAKWNLNDEFVESVYLFAPLHDIGKIGIPDKILLKPGQLDRDERVIMESHVDKGVKIIDKIVGDMSDNLFTNLSILRNIVGAHHEYLDGSGYPHGLKGADIKIESRVVTVADIYDALTAHRPYKKEWTIDKALAEIRQMQLDGKLDADCVDALFAHKEELRQIHERYFDIVH